MRAADQRALHAVVVDQRNVGRLARRRARDSGSAERRDAVAKRRVEDRLGRGRGRGQASASAPRRPAPSPRSSRRRLTPPWNQAVRRQRRRLAQRIADRARPPCRAPDRGQCRSPPCMRRRRLQREPAAIDVSWVGSKFQRSSFAFSACGMANTLSRSARRARDNSSLPGKAVTVIKPMPAAAAAMAASALSRALQAGPNRAGISMTGIMPHPRNPQTCSMPRLRRSEISEIRPSGRSQNHGSRHGFAAGKPPVQQPGDIPVNTRILRPFPGAGTTETTCKSRHC